MLLRLPASWPAEQEPGFLGLSGEIVRTVHVVLRVVLGSSQGRSHSASQPLYLFRAAPLDI